MKSTKNIKVPAKVVDQVIGQEEAVNIIKKAALQRRHVLLIGEPGTGKSMLGIALSELLPKSELQDVIAYQNPNDENEPIIKTVDGGKGREEIQKAQMDSKQLFKNMRFLSFILAIIVMIAPWWARWYYKSDVMFTAFFIGGMMFLVAFSIMMNLGPKALGGAGKTIPPKLIVDNFNKKKAPFFDATSTHAGALLGDVLHDPLQSFLSSNRLQVIDNKNNYNEMNMQELLDPKFVKYSKEIIKRKEKNHEAIFLSKNELTTLGETNGSVSPVKILSSNRYNHEGEMIKFTTSENKELIVTPEHKVALSKYGKIVYVESQHVKEGDEVVSRAEDIIIDEQDIINTYDKRQQEQCKLFYEYHKIKKENPTWGYKRIARYMNQPISKTRWWHAEKYTPVPIQTIEWLKAKNLIPLKIHDERLPLISKIIGATFGDGGIFENLNAVFLSSKEICNVEEFGDDLKKVFGEEIIKNYRIIEGGEVGHSWCYQNTNRKVIRFLVALGSPKGKKTSQDLIIPSWIYTDYNNEVEFFGSLFGSEMGVPKVHVSGNCLNTFCFAISGKENSKSNRIEFFSEIQSHLRKINVECSEIKTRKTQFQLSPEPSIIYRLLLSTKFESLINFVNNSKLNYCKYKREKLTNTINKFKMIKKEKYDNLINSGLGAESAMNQLKLTPKALYQILNDTEYIVKEEAMHA